jgi:hypothetical protein
VPLHLGLVTNSGNRVSEPHINWPARVLHEQARKHEQASRSCRHHWTSTTASLLEALSWCVTLLLLLLLLQVLKESCGLCTRACRHQ